MGKMNKRKKEEIADDWCFICKDGGSLRVCDFRDCLKAYHPHCVGEDDSFLKAGNYWTCGSHFCFICHKGPKFKCFCCPRAVCACCIYEAEFAVVKGAKGLCIDCSRLALLIETEADVDSDEVKIDFKDKDTYEGLFKDYYEIVKKKEGLNSKHVYTAHNLLKSGKKDECDSFEIEGESDDDSNFTVSDYDDLNDTTVEKSVRKKCTKKIESTKGKVKGKKNEFIGWCSKSLTEFLQYIGEDTSRELSEHDVASMIIEYCKVNKLFDSVKKKKVLCDAPLQSLLRRKSVNRKTIHKLLVPHFAQNSEEIEDIISSNSEDRDDNKPFKVSRQSNLISSTHSQQNLMSEEYQNCLAAIISSNVKLVYLKRSLVEELLKQPETFDGKVMGSFVRVKTDPNDYLQTNSHQLLEVVGINRPSKNDEVEKEIRLQLPCVPKDVPICNISDDDFSEEECNYLHQRMRDGLLKQPTVLELEQKARSLHEDIMKHWIPRELALLQNRIDRANEKGWRRELYEYMELKLKLQSQEEQSRLLSDIPKVIPEIVDTKLSQEGSPRKEDKPKQNGLLEVAMGGETCNSVGHYSRHSGFAYDLKNASDTAGDSQMYGTHIHDQLGHSSDTQIQSKGMQVYSRRKKGMVKVGYSGRECRNERKQLEERQNGRNLNDTRDAKQTIKKKQSISVDDHKHDTRVSPIPVREKEAIISSADVIELSSDDDEADANTADMSNGKKVVENPEIPIWHLLSASGLKSGPYSMHVLKIWNEAASYPLEFKVWKNGQSEREAILLTDALRQNFPSM